MPTSNYSLPLLTGTNDISDEYVLINQALGLIDGLLQTITTDVLARALLEHIHDIEDVAGLTAALAAKAASNHTHTLNDLSNVDAVTASANMALVFNGSGWQPTIFNAAWLGGTLADARLPARLSDAALEAKYLQIGGATGLLSAANNLSDLANAVTARSNLGLGNVNNTSDLSKPISTAVQTALNGKANTSHTHTISNVTGLQTALDGKAALSHTHAISQVTGLQTALDAKAANTVNIGAGTGLTGGGNLTANRTISANIASQAEAEAGTISTKLMTPQRTAQAIAALAGSTPVFSGLLSAPTSGQDISWAHGLGVTPQLFGCYLQCATNDGEYVVGDQVNIGSFDSGGSRHTAVWANATTVNLSTVSSLLFANKTSNAGIVITPANWRVVFWAQVI